MRAILDSISRAAERNYSIMEDAKNRAPESRKKRVSFDAGATWAIIGSFALGALAFVPVPTIPFLYTKVTLLAIGLLIAAVAYILARLSRGSAIVPPLPLLGALWLVPFAYLLSGAFSAAGLPASFFGTELETDTLGFVMLLATFATLAALSFRRTDAYRAFFCVGAIVAAVVLVAQTAIVITGRIAPQIISPSTNLIGSFTDLGLFLGLVAVLLLLALRLLPLSDRFRTLLMILGGVSLLGIALVNATVVWVLVGLVSLALFIEAMMKRRGTGDDADLEGVALMLADDDDDGADVSSRSLGVSLAALALSVFFIIGGSTIGSAFSAALGVNVIDVRPSWQSTFDIGSHTYAASPLFGSGPGSFDAQWTRFRDASLNDTVFWNVDFASGIGYIPTSFVTTGLVGAIAWLAFIGLFLVIGGRMLITRLPQDAWARFASIASFVGILYMLAIMTFAVPGPIVLVAGFLLFGTFVSSLRYAQGAREQGIVFSRSPRAGFVIVFALTLLLLACVLGTYAAVERYLSSVAYAEAVSELNEGNVDGALVAANRSLAYAESDRAYQLIATAGIARMNQIANDTELGQAEAQSRFQGALSGSIEAALAATRLEPASYRNWTVLGNVYQTVVPLNIEGAYENARTAYDQAVALHPTSPMLPYIIAQLEIADENPEAASEALLQSISLKRDYTQAIVLLSQLEVEQGRAREALEAAEAAAYFAPNDPAVLFQTGILRSANGDTQGAIEALSRAVALNPQYANARFFLGAMLAIAGEYEQAAAELEAVSALSSENAEAVASDLAAVRDGRNPFSPARLGALGIPQGPLMESAAAPAR